MNTKRVLAIMIAATMVMVLPGCTGKEKEENLKEEAMQATEFVYERNVVNANEVAKTPYNFGTGNIAANARAVRVELTLEDDTHFSMNVHGWMQEDTEGSEHAVGEAFEYGEGMYAEFMSSAEGSYVQNGNEITVLTESATYEIPDLGVSYFAQIFAGSNASGGSFAPEGEDYFGKWSSEDNSAILDLFPETTFITDNNEIVSWERAGRLTEALGENSSMVFYKDGSAYYQDTENGLSSDMTWSVENDNVTIVYNGAEGEITVTGNTSEELAITLRQYKDATTFNDYTQNVTITDENISALR